jgi:hypothetical protein
VGHRASHPEQAIPGDVRALQPAAGGAPSCSRGNIEPLIGDEDEATEKVAAPELEALRQFEDTAPTTLVGLLAMIIYAGEINDQNADAFDRNTPIFENMATAAAAFARVRS